jgi:hypothetical protein
VITDLDAVNDDNEACEVSIGTKYSNAAIKLFFGKASLDDLKNYNLVSKCFNKVNNIWQNSQDGKLCVVYQTKESDYNARSFEDAYIHINREFIATNKDNFEGLKNRNLFDDKISGSYLLAEKCINKKTHFAMDIIYHSDKNFANWKIPHYIKEGLLWLKKD